MAAGCNGYDLIADLDFDTNGDSVVDANDDYFDYDGDGSNSSWFPVGTSPQPYAGNFDGTYHTFTKLTINRPAGDAETNGNDIGLFGAIDGQVKSFTDNIKFALLVSWYIVQIES